MAITVYDHPLSPYAQKVKIALAEKGIPFEARLPEAIGSGATSGEFQVASPRGEVPALVDGDVRPSVIDCTKAAAAVAFGSEAISLEAVRVAMEQGLFKREYRDHRLEWMVKTGGLDIVADGLEKANIRFIQPFPAGKS